MPIIKPIITQIDMDETLRYAGLSLDKGWHPELLSHSLQELMLVAKPLCVYTIQPHTAGVIGGYSYTSKGLKRHLQDCEQVVVLAATLGSDVDRRVELLFAQDKYTMGLLVNAAATAMIEQAADYLTDFLYRSQFAKLGYSLGSRFSPGYSDWALEEQRCFFPLTQGEQIGIGLTTAFSLNPKKSITAVMPILQQVENKQMCTGCMQAACAFRK